MKNHQKIFFGKNCQKNSITKTNKKNSPAFCFNFNIAPSLLLRKVSTLGRGETTFYQKVSGLGEYK